LYITPYPEDTVKPLPPRQIEALPAGVNRIADQLYLKRIDGKSSTSRTVLFRWQQDGKGKVLSLGAWSADRYSEFLALGVRYRQAVEAGHDPTVERVRATAPATFREAATVYYDQATFRSAKHLQHCRDSMDTVSKILGDLRFSDIQTEHVARSLEGVWLATPTTGRRVLRRIREVIDFGFARNGIEKFNPATWDRIKHILPKQPKHRTRHFKALPYTDIPAFYESLPGNEVMTAAALRFLVLTCTRTNETVQARWSEIDFTTATWAIGGGRMKAARDFRVALSAPAIGILRPLFEHRINDWIFPGRIEGESLGRGALCVRLRDMGHRKTFTIHGFRSGFKDWARESQTFGWELVELALSHEIGDATERSYGRSDLLHLRRPLMEAWGGFVTGVARSPRLVLSSAA
jgi:integrase